MSLIILACLRSIGIKLTKRSQDHPVLWAASNTRQGCTVHYSKHRPQVTIYAYFNENKQDQKVSSWVVLATPVAVATGLDTAENTAEFSIGQQCFPFYFFHLLLYDLSLMHSGNGYQNEPECQSPTVVSALVSWLGSFCVVYHSQSTWPLSAFPVITTR